MPETSTANSLSDMPNDELARYGLELGLAVNPQTPRGELLRRIHGRQELLRKLERAALLDIVIWARRPVRETASCEELAREISQIQKMRFEGLSDRGLYVLALLREVDAREKDSRAVLVRRLKRAEGVWRKLGRKTRRALGSVVAHIVEDQDASPHTYRFLPEESGNTDLREHIEEQGLVGGIARRLRGAADDYIADKLDEIEERIDRKLDEIDHRLAEWRDREVVNRLRIIKITLAASVLVALLSLGYHYVMGQMTDAREGGPPSAAEQGQRLAGPDSGTVPADE